MELLLVALLLTSMVLLTEAEHFRGGTINWKSEGGKRVRFYFKLGFTYNGGPGCTEDDHGKFARGARYEKWKCTSGCYKVKYLDSINYYCTGASKEENWEQGRKDFVYKFPSYGPYTVGYTNNNWILLSNGKGNGTWNVETTVDLRPRSDTGNPNSSPESQSKPMYFVQFGCEINLKLPVIDPDNDNVRCRWATGDECGSVCDALPGAILDPVTCTLVFKTTAAEGYEANGTYVAALTIEDYPKHTMRIGKATKTPNDALSSIPLQFLIKSVPQTGSCDAGPRFVPPTPTENEVIAVEEGDKLEVVLSADNNKDTTAKANKIRAFGPLALTQSPVLPDKIRPNIFTTTLSWQTKAKDLGGNIVCASVSNDQGKSGNQRCFTLHVFPKGCKLSPCKNNGKCVPNAGKYKCVCRRGFTGFNCETNIDDCKPNPCSNGEPCIDGFDSYSCGGVKYTTSATTKTKTKTKTIIATTTTLIKKPSTTSTTRTTTLITTPSTTSTTTTTTTLTTTPATTSATKQNNNNNSCHKGACQTKYDDCKCVTNPHKRVIAGNTGLSSRITRDLFGIFIGFPLGLMLSVLTLIALRPWVEHCHGREPKKYPQSRPIHLK